MKQKEWVEQFQAANGRKPNKEELQAALQRGDFKKKMKTSTIVIISLVSVFAVLLLVAGGLAAYYYTAGNVDGVWERESSSYYSSKKHQWLNENKEYKQSKIGHHNFIEVKNGSVKNYSYYELKQISSDIENDGQYGYAVYTGADGHIRPMYKIDNWTREFKFVISQKNYMKDTNKYIDEFVKTKYSSSDDMKKLKESYKDSYKDSKKEKITYQKKGNRLFLKRYNKKGKLINKATFVKRSGKSAVKLKEKYRKVSNMEIRNHEKLESGNY